MKTKLLFAAALAMAATWSTHASVPPPASANYKCGIKPLPPLGCKRSDAVCICERTGPYGSGETCRWVFMGCGS